MFKVLKYSYIKIMLFLSCCTFIFYLPILFNLSLIPSRNNDLQQFFWPVFYFTKHYIFTDNNIPLWNNIILADVYSNGWNAYLNGKEKVPVQETPTSSILVKIQSNTKFIKFRYMPDSFKTSITITSLMTLCIIILLMKK